MLEQHVRIDTSRGIEIVAGDRRIGLHVGHDRATALLSDDDFEALTDFVLATQKQDHDFTYLKAIAAAVKRAIARGALADGTVRITGRDIYLAEHEGAP
ncbi:hypothetical protein [Sphingomonas sp. BAUL-RG-20F-R05-02]|uniref:hypothetical protein n=1 Tax=Sphingomonas sp. BAUL-RG-20F-R05-02 TaxID=2914830 RepID=UPI001F59029C|nr:hypothetical protein [Sphingomonas sp. BAUL-RG-20F-R05-02]